MGQSPWGELADDAPYMYQRVGGREVAVAGRFALVDSNTYRFDVTGPYDPGKELVIDPELVWSSYLGGSGQDSVHDVVVDGAGNAFVTGWTNSSDFPTAGGFDPTYNGGGDPDWPGGGDAFVAKISAGGALLWSSYLGGSDRDLAHGIALDAVGNAFVTGGTRSPDFPTAGGFDMDYGGGWDAFVTKISAGGQLLWSSYLGGSSHDGVGGIAVDAAGNAFVTGWTLSSDFPTAGGFDATYNDHDAFVAKISAGGELLWSSYLGGRIFDRGWDMALDAAGNVFVTGDTMSPDFPTTGGFDATLGRDDAFVAKISADGQLLWSS